MSAEERKRDRLNINDFHAQKSLLKKVSHFVLIFVLFLILVLYGSTCIKQVKVQETGVLLRFGKIVQKRVDPGMCFKLPWPIDRLVNIKTQSIETMIAGFGEDKSRVEEFERSYGPLDQLTNGTLTIPYIISGDKNVLHLKVLINYRISDPTVFAFEVSDGKAMLALLTQHIILQYVSSAQVDDLLTSGKLKLRDYINRAINAELETKELGMRVVSVEIRNVRPPGSTSQAFKDVINAQEESREMIHQAESYSKRVILEAKASARQVLSEAEAYRTKTIESATGEADRFRMLASEYDLYPEVTRERLRRETFETIFPNMKKFIVGKSSKGQASHLRFVVNPD